MKNFLLSLGTIMMVLVVLALTITPVMAGEKTESTCSETLISVLNPGTWTYPDGNIHIRGLVQFYRDESPDPRLDGYNTIVTNANWRGDWSGPMWGTFHLVTDQGGWDGTWTGKMTEMGPELHGTGNGYGAYAGMKMWVEESSGSCKYVILEP